VRPWLLRRPELGQYEIGMYEKLMGELMQEDPGAFTNFVRVQPAMFHELMERVGERIRKYDTHYRKALEPGLRLSIALRFYASGDSYKSLMYGFRVSDSTISLIMRQVSEAIIAELAEEVLVCPTTEEEWREVALQFKLRWQFLHCLGALDGKHIAIKCPHSGGSLYFNYKGFHSLILFALVDADYKFLWVDVGANGATSDAQLFEQCELRQTIEDGSINFPAPDPLPGDDKDMDYFIIGDDAFPLRQWLMKPYG